MGEKEWTAVHVACSSYDAASKYGHSLEALDSIHKQHEKLVGALQRIERVLAPIVDGSPPWYERTTAHFDACGIARTALQGTEGPSFHATREFCGRCHDLSPVGFHAPDDTWRAVAGRWQHDILCIRCFAALGDEKFIAWEDDIEFYPVSFASHRSFVCRGEL